MWMTLEQKRTMTWQGSGLI